MEYELKTYGNYTYIIYKLKKLIDFTILDEIKVKAEEDAKKMRKEDPSGKIRPDDLIYFRNVGGVLAERIVKIHLQNLINKHKINARLLPSKFTTHAEHRDIKIEVNRKIKTIEVRSSFQYKTTVERVFTGSFCLLSTYTTSIKKTEIEKDFYITVIHRYEPKEILSKFDSSIEAFILGGGSKETFAKLGSIDPKLNQNKADYFTIRPIIKAPDSLIVFNEILDIKEQKRKQNFLEDF